MPGVPLDDGVRGILSAAGTLTLKAGPKRPNQWWTLTTIAVHAAASSSTPQVRVFRGDAVPTNQIDSTYNGDDDTSQISIVLHFGEFLTFQWSGGAAGTVVAASYYGEVNTTYSERN